MAESTAHIHKHTQKIEFIGSWSKKIQEYGMSETYLIMSAGDIAHIPIGTEGGTMTDLGLVGFHHLSAPSGSKTYCVSALCKHQRKTVLVVLKLVIDK